MLQIFTFASVIDCVMFITFYTRAEYHLYISICLYILYILYVLYVLYINNHATVWPTVHIIWSVTYSSRLDCFRVKRIIYVFVLNETTSCICDISEKCSHFIQDDWFNLISWLVHSNKKCLEMILIDMF